jgi:hypothetical protein
MTNEELNKIFEETFERIIKLRQSKAAEYNQGQGVFGTVERTAIQFGVSIETVLMIFASKHWSSCVDYGRDIDTGKTRTRTESINQRIDDLIVYLLMLKGAIVERHNAAKINSTLPPRHDS